MSQAERPEPCPGDAFLRTLLWEPPEEWHQELVWSYFTSRPRRYHLEPQLRCVLSAKFSSKYDRLEVRVILASNSATPLEFECWLAHDDLLLNPEHATVLTRYRALYDSRPCLGRHRHIPQKPDIEYPAVLLKKSKTRSSTSLASTISTPR